jgi:hypothetical protein
MRRKSLAWKVKIRQYNSWHGNDKHG